MKDTTIGIDGTYNEKKSKRHDQKSNRMKSTMV